MNMTKKLLNQLDIDELLESVTTNDDNNPLSKILDYNEVLKFLTTFNIQPGEHLVHVDLMYQYYKQWTLEEDINKITVTKRIKRYIPLEKKGHNNYFLINKDSIKFSEDVLSYLTSLRKRDKINSKHWGTHFQNFMRFNHIKEGNLYIEAYILHQLYDDWTYRRKLKEPTGKLGWKTFKQFCRMYLPIKIKNNTLYIGVTKDIYNSYLTEEKIKELRQFNDERQRKKHEAKKKKK